MNQKDSVPSARFSKEDIPEDFQVETAIARLDASQRFLCTGDSEDTRENLIAEDDLGNVEDDVFGCPCCRGL